MDAVGRRPARRFGTLAAGGLIVGIATIAALRGAGRSAPGPVLPARPMGTTTPSIAAAGPGAATGWVTTDEQLTEGGIARRYLVVRPPDRSARRLPVVVVLHGRSATPELEEQRTGFPALTGPAILVYPAGYQESWNAGACCAGAHAAGVDDVAFVTDVVHRVLASQPDADAGRVFLVGFSNGGKMAFLLTCGQPALFRAVAVVGAVPVAPCSQPPSVPFAELAFDQDPLLTLTPAQPPKPVNGFPQASLEDEVAALRTANQCQAAGRSDVQGTLTVTRWTDCRSGHPVEFGLYRGNAHVWPTGDASTPSAEQVIWSFFRSITEDR
jgi:polyhydroxybutyrate depolymerase